MGGGGVAIESCAPPPAV